MTKLTKKPGVIKETLRQRVDRLACTLAATEAEAREMRALVAHTQKNNIQLINEIVFLKRRNVLERLLDVQYEPAGVLV